MIFNTLEYIRRVGGQRTHFHCFRSCCHDERSNFISVCLTLMSADISGIRDQRVKYPVRFESYAPDGAAAILLLKLLVSRFLSQLAPRGPFKKSEEGPPGSMFIFDTKTEYAYDDASCSW